MNLGLGIQWPLVLFTVFAGIGAGMLVAAGVFQLAGKQDDRVQVRAGIASLVLLVIGGLFSMLHLASPGNVMAAVYNIGSFSGISIELILLGTTFILGAVFVILLARKAPGGAVKAFAVLTMVSAVLLMFFCGHGYVMPSRQAWNSNVLPLAYLGSILAAGVFAYGAVLAFAKTGGKSAPAAGEATGEGAPSAQPNQMDGEGEPAQAGEGAQSQAGGVGEDDVKLMRPLALAVSVICAVTCLAYAVFAGASGSSVILTFWIGVILCGIVLAVVVGVAAFRALSVANFKKLMPAGFVVLLIAALAVRCLMWQTADGYLELFNYAIQSTPYVP